MAWTAYFGDAIQRDGRWAFSIIYTDGAQKLIREYTVGTISDDTVREYARSEIAGFEVVKASVGKVSIRAGDQIDLTPSPMSKPSAADLARDQWLIDYHALQRLQRGLAIGLAAQKDVDAQLAGVTGSYRPEYAPLL